jgi:hypothetical protein
VTKETEKLDDLIQEVKGLREEVSQLKKEQKSRQLIVPRGIRKRSKTKLLGLPLYDIAIGPDESNGERRGVAKGIIAVGDVAAGVVAIGGVAFGAVAAGGLAIGVLGAAGGAALGALAAGGASVGIVAAGGAAVGVVAVGGATLSYCSWPELLAKLSAPNS